MEIWLDTTDIPTIKKAVQLGILSGITTNPSLIAASNRKEEDVLNDLLHYQEGPVAIQVTGGEVDQMVEEGRTYFEFSNRLLIKVPCSQKGYEAIQLLSREGISTIATVLFTPQQALIAAIAGADYVAPYLNRMELGGMDPWKTLSSIYTLLENYEYKTKILAASIKTVDQITKCGEIGVDCITLSGSLFNEFIKDHPLTMQGIQKFKDDYQKCQKKA